MGIDKAECDETLKHAALTGEFDVVGGKTGNMWTRLPKDNAFKMQSKETKTIKAKAAIRATWAKEEFEYILEEKTFEESYSRIDTTKGTFYTFGGLVRQLGGWS